MSKMSKKKSKLATAREQAEAALKQTNEKIADLGEKTSALYDQLCTIQAHFDKIRNVPSDEMIRYEKLKEIRLSWKQQAEKIEAAEKTQKTEKRAGRSRRIRQERGTGGRIRALDRFL